MSKDSSKIGRDEQYKKSLEDMWKKNVSLGRSEAVKPKRKKGADVQPSAEAEINHASDSLPDDSSNTDPSVGVKNDRKDHKLRWDLIPMEPMNELARVYTAGAEKYGPDRWQNLEDGFNRYRGAALRHLFEYMQGNRYDEETKCMHLAQFAWNALAMLWFDMNNKGRFPFKTLEEEKLEQMRLEKLIEGVMAKDEPRFVRGSGGGVFENGSLTDPTEILKEMKNGGNRDI